VCFSCFVCTSTALLRVSVPDSIASFWQLQLMKQVCKYVFLCPQASTALPRIVSGCGVTLLLMVKSGHHLLLLNSHHRTLLLTYLIFGFSMENQNDVCVKLHRRHKDLCIICNLSDQLFQISMYKSEDVGRFYSVCFWIWSHPCVWCPHLEPFL
jgi:hypothetical protein